MRDPFAAALGALHASPLAAAATYQAPGHVAHPIRVIRGQGDAVSPFARGKVVQATNALSILKSEVPNPVAQAIVTIYADPLRTVVVATLRLVGAAQLDEEGLSWRSGAEPA